MYYRIAELRSYLFGIINTLTTNRNYQINADMLGKVGDFSLDKIPTNTEVEEWIVPISLRREVYSSTSVLVGILSSEKSPTLPNISALIW